MDIESYIDSSFKRKFILRFCLGLIVVSLTSSILFFFLMPGGVAGVYSSFISDFRQARKMLGIVLFLIGVFEILMACLFTLIIVLFVSHKIGGPLFKLEQNIEKLKNRDLVTPPISFRSNDQGKILAVKFNEMLRNWNAPFTELKYDLCKFSIGMERFRRNWMQERKARYDVDTVRKVRHHVKKMENILDRFSTP
jgi:hypothetical protein